MATTYCKIISYGRRANLNYLNSLLTIFFFLTVYGAICTFEGTQPFSPTPISNRYYLANIR
jgi:hypothetical protein